MFALLGNNRTSIIIIFYLLFLKKQYCHCRPFTYFKQNLPNDKFWLAPNFLFYFIFFERGGGGGGILRPSAGAQQHRGPNAILMGAVGLAVHKFFPAVMLAETFRQHSGVSTDKI